MTSTIAWLDFSMLNVKVGIYEVRFLNIGAGTNEIRRMLIGREIIGA